MPPSLIHTGRDELCRFPCLTNPAAVVGMVLFDDDSAAVWLAGVRWQRGIIQTFPCHLALLVLDKGIFWNWLDACGRSMTEAVSLLAFRRLALS